MTQADAMPAAVDEAAWAHVRAIVAKSKTSFYWGMRVLPEARRNSMYALYAFCREVDDIADEPGDFDARVRALADWRAEIDRLYRGAPSRPIARALMAPVRAYDLPRGEFLAVIDGVEMDLREEMRAPTEAALDAYCRRVAGAVGMLSVRIFGAKEPEAEGVALALGKALQLTNVLRDLKEDAERGRLYLPRELLAAHGIAARDPDEVLGHAGLPQVCAVLAARARTRFREARELVAKCEREPMRPCILMMAVYERILARLEAGGWRNIGARVSLPTAEKLWIFVRYGLV